MKFIKLLKRIFWNLIVWYVAALCIHIASTFAGGQINILKCLQYVAEIHGGLCLIMWTFVGMLITLRDIFGILIQFRKPFRKKILRFPIVINKVL